LTVLDLNYARFKSCKQSENTLIKLEKNSRSFGLIFGDQPQLIENWLSVLKEICVMTDFEVEYRLLKMVAEDQLAQVIYCFSIFFVYK